MKFEVIKPDRSLKLEIGQEYYYIDLAGDIISRIYLAKPADNAIIDCNEIFIDIEEAKKYLLFWCITEGCASPFDASTDKMYTLVADPRTLEVSIVSTNEYIPNFIYFYTKQEAQEYINTVGKKDIIKYLYGIR